MNRGNIVCVGNLVQDHLLLVDALPRLDEVVVANEGMDCIGGRGANVALTLGRMTGQQVDLVTVLPYTQRTADNIRFLESNFVSARGIKIDSMARTEHETTVIVSGKDRNCISVFKAGDATFSATDSQKDLVRESSVAYFSTQNRRYNQELLSEVDPSRTTVIHNVATFLSSDAEYRKALLAKSHTIICNDHEAAALGNEEGLEDIADLFDVSSVLRSIYVTHGELGSTVYGRDRTQQQFGIYDCEVRVPVGAGDAYAAGVVYGISQQWTIAKGVELGSRLAALSVASSTSYPNLSQVQDVLRQTRELSSTLY